MPKPRLLVARPVPTAVTERATTEFDAVLSGDRDLSPDDVIQRLAGHHADALFFSSNLKLTADFIGRLP